MEPVRDITLPLPEAAAPAITAAITAHGRRAAGIHLAPPGPGDPPGTIARYAWPLPHRPWAARGTLGRRGNLLEVTTITLTPLPGAPAGAVTSELLRAVSLAAITTAAQAHITLSASAGAALARALQVPAPAPPRTRPSRQGRPPLDDSLLRAAAEAFLDEAARGPGIYDRIAARLEAAASPPFTTGQVRTALTRAQQDGWITPGKRGKGAQRSPGPRLIREWQRERTG